MKVPLVKAGLEGKFRTWLPLLDPSRGAPFQFAESGRLWTFELSRMRAINQLTRKHDDQFQQLTFREARHVFVILFTAVDLWTTSPRLYIAMTGTTLGSTTAWSFSNFLERENRPSGGSEDLGKRKIISAFQTLRN